MELRQALQQQNPSLELIRSAANEIARLDSGIRRRDEFLEAVIKLVPETPELLRGRQAAQDPAHTEDNPYKAGTSEHIAWCIGFRTP